MRFAVSCGLGLASYRRLQLTSNVRHHKSATSAVRGQRALSITLCIERLPMKQPLLLCLAGTLALAAFAQDQSLQPEMGPVEALKPHLATSPHQIRKVVYDYELTGSATARGETVVEHQRLDSGFLTSTSRTVLQDGKGGGNTLLVTACGLVTLSMQRYTVAVGPASLVNLAGAFVGLGMKTSTDVNWSARLISIQVNEGNICHPKAGAQLKFFAETEHAIKVAGKLMSGVRKETTICNAANSTSPVSDLVSSTSGRYLPVSCETTTSHGSRVVRKYAFLDEAGQYLLLDESEGRSGSLYRPKLIELAP